MKKITEFNRQLINKYFTEFLPSAAGKSIFAELDNLHVVFSFYFTDTEETWTVSIVEGRIEKIDNESESVHEVSFGLDYETFIQIVSGKMTPQESFFKNLSNIDGDILKGLKLASIFERFIREFPFKREDINA